MVLVDASVWIEASRRDGELAYKVGLEALLEEYEATLCSPVRQEVLGGARQGDRLKLIRRFEILPFVQADESTWESATEFSWKLRDAGLAVPWNDILIAAIAHQQVCRVYAKDKHFDAMSGVVGVRLYQAGYGGSYNRGNEA
jgi:predicted nucleic acid-binding protein